MLCQPLLQEVNHPILEAHIEVVAALQHLEALRGRGGTFLGGAGARQEPGIVACGPAEYEQRAPVPGQ